MSATHFSDLNLIDPLLRALSQEGYTTPTPIQQKAIPEVLRGRDLLATAQTGTGKTAAFSLPLLQRLHESPPARKGIRALILTPTRELALQIDLNIKAYGRHLSLQTAVILGGVSSGAQIRQLRTNPEILIATPGRLLDLMQQGHVRLGGVETLVLDEADRMLDMGFIRDVRRVVAEVPKKRQTLLFSATMSDEIADLAATMLHDPAAVAVTPAASVSQRITQHVLFVDQAKKRDLLVAVLKDPSVQRALVFTRTKHRANRVAQNLCTAGIGADAIHSNKSQNARQRALQAFERGKVKVLVATDIVARGIDVEGITHVINFELPQDLESYVHRIGRTARAGAEGIAFTFCDTEEVGQLRSIERLTGQPLAPADHPYHSALVEGRYQQARPGRLSRPSGAQQSARNGHGGNGRNGNGRGGNGRGGNGAARGPRRHGAPVGGRRRPPMGRAPAASAS